MCFCHLRGPLAGAENYSRVFQGALNHFCDRMRAAEHAPRNASSVLERHYGLAEIVERGGGFLAERHRVHQSHPEREIITLSENARRRRLVVRERPAVVGLRAAAAALLPESRRRLSDDQGVPAGALPPRRALRGADGRGLQRVPRHPAGARGAGLVRVVAVAAAVRRLRFSLSINIVLRAPL